MFFVHVKLLVLHSRNNAQDNIVFSNNHAIRADQERLCDFKQLFLAGQTRDDPNPRCRKGSGKCFTTLW